MIAPVIQADIKIGEHVQREFLGMTFNLDTIWALLVAGTVVMLLGFWARSQLTKNTEDHVPTKLQLIWETVVDKVNVQVEDNLGQVNAYVVALAISLFFFILICNWLEMIPTELNHKAHLLPAPTADTNLTYAHGAVRDDRRVDLRHPHEGREGLLQPLRGALPVPAAAEHHRGDHQADLAGPPTLRQHLRRRHPAGPDRRPDGLDPGPGPRRRRAVDRLRHLWKLFDMAIGAIQAFIFALLTVLYFGMAR